MGDEEGGLVHRFGEFEELVLQPAPDQRIEGRERLVHEQDVGIRRHGAGEADALLHAARKLVGAPVAIALQMDKSDDAVGDPRPWCGRPPP